MSTKTLRKRIALATVAALGAGVLSLVSMPAASAYAGVNDNAAAGVGNSTTAAADVLNIGTKTNTSGNPVVPTATNVTSPNYVAVADSAASSVGLVNVSDIAGGRVAGTTATATLVAGGKLVVYTSLAASKEYTIVVTGGTLSSATTNTTGINAGSTAIAASTSGGAALGYFAAVATPSGGAGTTMTVAFYGGASAASVASPTSGTLLAQYTVSIVAASTAGAVSTAKSGVWYAHTNYGGVASLTSDDTHAATEANPTGGSGAYGVIQYANIRLRDAYGTAITNSSSGLLSASATNGALVSIGAVTTAGTPVSTSAFTTGNSGAFDNSFLAVKNPGDGPLDTTVTVTYNGTVIGTKTFKFTGKVAKVTLAAQGIGTTASTGLATIAFADSAGNTVYPSASSTYYPATGLSTDGDTLNSYVISGAMGTNSGAKLWPTTSSSGYWEWTCVGTTVGAGKANVGVIWTNLDGSLVKSNAIEAKCAAGPYTYTAELDKATYMPGDIAKLTVTFKDSKGNLAGDTGGSNYASTVATTAPELDGGNLSLIGGTDSNTGKTSDSTTFGVVTYKFVVGAPTVDPYSGQLVVTFPTITANGVATAQTVQYKIASGSTSLNDVLKGIVSLIASINKQIAALAKLVAPTKKKK